MRFYLVKSSMTYFYVTTLSSFQRTILKELHSFKTKQNVSFIALLSFLSFSIERGDTLLRLHPNHLSCLLRPPPKRLGYHIRALQTFVAWRAVCTTPGNVFTLTFWFRITSDSNFMKSSCRLQSELRPILEFCSTSQYCFSLYWPL